DTTIDKFQDARSCWFSLDRLKKFICLMEQYSAKARINKPLGIRFYYADYSKDSTRCPYPNYIKHHTLHLVPTYVDSKKIISFDPKLSRPGHPVTIVDKIKANSPDTLFILSGLRVYTSVLPDQNAAMNQGNLCPPGEGCDDVLKAIDDDDRYK